MKSNVVSRVVSGVLVAVGLLLGGAVAAERATSVAPQELLSQFVNIDRPDFKAKGKITLHRLQPLAGQLVLSEAEGDPEWIFKTIAPWNAQLSKMLQELKIRKLTLAGSDLLLDGQRIEWRLDKAVIPEGWIEKVNFQRDAGGAWSVSTGKMQLERLPERLHALLLAGGAVGFEQMQASGTAQQGQGWADGVAGPGWRVGRLEGRGEVSGWNAQGLPARGLFSWQGERVVLPGLQAQATRIPALAELLRFAGKNPARQETLHLDQVRLQLEESGGRVTPVRKVGVESAWLQAWGEGTVENKSQAVKLNLTARTPDNKKKAFKLRFPLSALVEP